MAGVVQWQNVTLCHYCPKYCPKFREIERTVANCSSQCEERYSFQHKENKPYTLQFAHSKIVAPKWPSSNRRYSPYCPYCPKFRRIQKNRCKLFLVLVFWPTHALTTRFPLHQSFWLQRITKANVDASLTSDLAISNLFTAIERKLSRGILRTAVSGQPKEPTSRYQEHSRQSNQRFAPISKGVNKEID